MDISKRRYYVGTSRGVLLCTTDKPNNVKAFKNSEITEITALAEGKCADEILVGYSSGNVHLFDIAKASFTKKLNKLDGEEKVTGLFCVGKFIVVAKRNGVINLWSNNKKNECFSLDLDKSASLDAVEYNNNRENIIGTGGEANDFKLWNIETKQCIFKAKSLGHDFLQLPIPTSIRGINFFPEEPNLTSCCTKEGHVLLYDDRAQRKPIVQFCEEKASYSTISAAFRENQVLVGTTRGFVQRVDLKKSAKILKTYTTFTGGVSDIVCDPLEPFFATVSLDRYLRVHNLETKELVSKIYMKQNLTKVLVKPVMKDEEEEEDASDSVNNKESLEIDQEYEELFNNMEEIQDKSSSEIKKIKRKLKKNVNDVIIISDTTKKRKK